METETGHVIERTFNGAMFPLPGVYAPDSTHTFVDFRMQHLVIGHILGHFDEVKGSANIPEDPTQSSSEVTFVTASVSTHNAMRHEDLRSPRFFDAERFPTTTYHSTSAAPEFDDAGRMPGR